MIASKERYRHFRKWQDMPHAVKPLSEEEHECSTCHTVFYGNYCPRCGQSASIGRYSFKRAFLLFLDVWGLGNRGMFRTLRDLVLRPGYMIRDYLSGMQMAYFPPFKLFFLLVALSLLVDSGWNLQGKNHIKEQMEQFEKGLKKSEAENKLAKMEAEKFNKKLDKITSAEEREKAKQEAITQQAIYYTMQKARDCFEYFYQYKTFAMLIFLLIVSCPLYLCYRHCPNIPDMRFSEFFVAMVYINSLVTIFTIVISFFFGDSDLDQYAYLLIVFPLKQLSGYSYLSTILRTFITLALVLALIFVLLIVGGIAYGFIMASQP